MRLAPVVIVVSCSLVFFVGSSLKANDLNLQQALELAFAGNETPELAQTRIDVARATLKAAYSTLLPSLSAGYSYRAFSSAAFGFGAGGFLPPGNIVSARVRMNVLTPSAFAQIAAAKTEVDASRRQAEETQRLFAYEVAEAYLAAQISEGLQHAAEQRRSVAQQMFSEAQERVNAGMLSANAATRSELEVKTAELVVIEASRTVRSTRLGLSYLLNADVRAPLADPDSTWFDLDRAIDAEQALAQRPDVWAQERRTKAAQQLLWEPWLRFLPSIDVEAALIQNVDALLAGQSPGYFIGANLTWEMYDGGLRYAQVRQRRAELLQQELGLSALRRQVPVELAIAQQDLNAALAGVSQAEATVVVAKRNHHEVGERFTHGLATALELADATASLYEAQASLMRQTLSFRLANLNVQRALGYWPGFRRQQRHQGE